MTKPVKSSYMKWLFLFLLRSWSFGSRGSGVKSDLSVYTSPPQWCSTPVMTSPSSPKATDCFPPSSLIPLWWLREAAGTAHHTWPPKLHKMPKTDSIKTVHEGTRFAGSHFVLEQSERSFFHSSTVGLWTPQQSALVHAWQRATYAVRTVETRCIYILHFTVLGQGI